VVHLHVKPKSILPTATYTPGHIVLILPANLNFQISIDDIELAVSLQANSQGGLIFKVVIRKIGRANSGKALHFIRGDLSKFADVSNWKHQLGERDLKS